MTKLSGINVRSIKVLKAVGELCPKLKSVSFMDCIADETNDPNDFADPSQMESLLKDWPMQVKLVINFISTLSSF